MPKKKQVGLKPTERKLEEKVSFSFVYQSNAERVAIALCSAGYFVNIINIHNNYVVTVLEQ